jgi:hypothetical protein
MLRKNTKENRQLKIAWESDTTFSLKDFFIFNFSLKKTTSKNIKIVENTLVQANILVCLFILLIYSFFFDIPYSNVSSIFILFLTYKIDYFIFSGLLLLLLFFFFFKGIKFILADKDTVMKI